MSKPVSTYLVLERFVNGEEWNLYTISTPRRAKREYERMKAEDNYESLLLVHVLEADCDWL